MKSIRSGIKAVGATTLIGAIFAAKLVLSADAPGRFAMNAIIEGAKKEGKVSWGSYLDDAEVGDLNKAFQKEFPFVKVEYTRLRPPYERLLLEMQAGTFPYDTFAIRPNLIGQHRQLGYLIDPIDWKSIFSVDPRMVHPEGIAVSVITKSRGYRLQQKSRSQAARPQELGRLLRPFF
jgi:spermidine/putrescine-binding protein